MTLHIPFSNAYAQLPGHFYAQVLPGKVKQPALIRFNHQLAAELGFDSTQTDAQTLADIFTGNTILDESEPLAMAYSGHQFGQLNPQLGDGRAILLGDLLDTTGQRKDIQLKGAGTTPFSRMGDGRCPLGPALREYILCEAMHALGVPTTRALAVASTGERVVRDRLEPGAVFTRVASSHIRVGTFQYFALRRDAEALTLLADHVLERHYPHIDTSADDKYLQMFKAICQRQAELIALWMNIGFIHGVMNTDNMTASGETIDYGPCAFIDAFRRETVFSSIDRNGRYAYINQPAIAQWNLARLAETLLSLFPGDEKQSVEQATDILQDFAQWHQDAWLDGFNRKLGFASSAENDKERAEALLDLLQQGGIDFTLFFRRLSDLADKEADRSALLALLDYPEVRKTSLLQQNLNDWLDNWQQDLAHRESDLHAAQQRMKAASPALIPRNHNVQAAIRAAEEGDFSVFENLLSALQQPFADIADDHPLSTPPTPQQQVLKTFCGT